MTTPAPARIAGLTQLAVLATCLLLAGPVSRAQELALEPDQAEQALEELETIVVYGGLAAPQMWKVSRGEHVMWIVGNRSAPAGATWRMEELEARVAESQLVMLPGQAYANPDVGIFKVLTLIRSAFKAAKNPGGQTLKDVLPPETYARWRALKTTYVGRDNDIEEWRPSIALSMLEEEIEDKLRPKRAKEAGRPASGPLLQPLIEKMARKKRVKTRTMRKVERKVEVSNIREMLKSTHTLSLVDQKCVADYIGYLEQLADFLKQDLDESPRTPANCNEGDMYIRSVRAGDLPDSVGFVKLIDELELQNRLAREQLDAEWIKAAQAALEKNVSTVAVLQMVNVQGPRSYLDKLRALGYSIEEPPGAP